jgi:hypothetical protein
MQRGGGHQVRPVLACQLLRCQFLGMMSQPAFTRPHRLRCAVLGVPPQLYSPNGGGSGNGSPQPRAVTPVGMLHYSSRQDEQGASSAAASLSSDTRMTGVCN